MHIIVNYKKWKMENGKLAKFTIYDLQLTIRVIGRYWSRGDKLRMKNEECV